MEERNQASTGINQPLEKLLIMVCNNVRRTLPAKDLELVNAMPEMISSDTVWASNKSINSLVRVVGCLCVIILRLCSMYHELLKDCKDAKDAIEENRKIKFDIIRTKKELAALKEQSLDLAFMDEQQISEECAHQLELLNIYRTRLRVLELQAARSGHNTPPEVLIAIADEKEKIRAARANLDRMMRGRKFVRKAA
jgi:hypothetical protein